MIALACSLPVAAVYIITGKQIISFLYGENYVLAWVPLVILSMGYLSMSFLGCGGVILTMYHFEKDTAKTTGAGALANILLNAILIPKYGVHGAALSTALAVTFRVSMVALFIHKRTGINTTVFALLAKPVN